MLEDSSFLAIFNACVRNVSARLLANVAICAICSSEATVRKSLWGMISVTNFSAPSFPNHLEVGSSPANLQICPTVGALVMSICAIYPADNTGPMPGIDSAH